MATKVSSKQAISLKIKEKISALVCEYGFPQSTIYAFVK